MKTKTKKIVVISLGDVRDTAWEEPAEFGLVILKRIRESGLNPSTMAPYISDGGDVPLVITVTIEESTFKKNVNFLKSIVGDKGSVEVFTEDEWDSYCNDG